MAFAIAFVISITTDMFCFMFHFIVFDYDYN